MTRNMQTSPKISNFRKLRELRNIIGGTPLLAIRGRFEGAEFVIYAKQESVNFTGSIKDRMALHILTNAYQNGSIAPGDVIAEATSGNTGISLAAIGRALGHPVRIYMPDWMSRERILLLKSLGVELITISAAEGGFLASIARAEEFAKSNDNVFLPRQFANKFNVAAHYATTGPEIAAQLASIGKKPAAIVAGVGTGGTIMGAGAYLKKQFGNVSVHPLEPANSPTLRTGVKSGKHRIQGISDEFVPAIVHLSEMDEIVDIGDADAIRMSQKLAAELGLAVGISSGANFLGALKIAARSAPGAAVVTIFADDNKKYLSTDLCQDVPSAECAFADAVELYEFSLTGRCATCGLL
ncbi:MAG: cysteine synthase family protein [Planctomycetes bacterium]|nr:cysteine synthase family protein [Planctomycetota bacterium]